MNEIEKYARAAASTARTPPNSPARQAAIEAENAARVAAEQFAANRERRIADLEAKVDTLKRLHDKLVDERDEAANIASALPRYYGSGDDGAGESLAQAIEDLHLPTGSRQAVVRLTDDQFDVMADFGGW